MSAPPVFSLEEALVQIERLLKDGDVESAKATVARGLELIPFAHIDKGKPEMREFAHAFETACRKHRVRAAYFIMEFPKAGDRGAHVYTGGHSGICKALDAVVAAGLHAIVEKH